MAPTSWPTGPGGRLFLLSLAFAGCAAPVTLRVQPPFCAVVGPAIIAHRGGSLEAPENTAEAVAHGFAAGADWVEIDVMMTADDQVVLFHDDLLERTTSGNGPFLGKTLPELRELTAGRPTPSPSTLERMAKVGVEPVDFGDRFAAARVPTLEEALAIPGPRLMIELKKGPWGKKLAEAVVDQVARAGAQDRVAIGSFQADLLWAAHDADPSLPLVGIADEAAKLTAMLDLPISVLAVNAEIAEAALKTAPAGIAVWCWTVYEVGTAQRLMELGVHGLITDVPQTLVTAMRAPQDVVVPMAE